MSKPSKTTKPQTINELLAQPIDTQLIMLSHYLEICLLVVNQVLQNDVKELAGERYSREKPHDGRFSRWGTNPGSVQIGAQKLPIDVPRIYDNEEKCHRPLDSYTGMKQMPEATEEVKNAILMGIGTRNYERVIRTVGGSFGLSRNQMSEAFIAQSTEALREFNERSFAQHRFVALFIDGKSQQKQQMVIVLGIDEKGEKIPLGFVQTTTENAEVVKELFHNLIDRGLRFDKGLLFVIDGAKGLRKAIEDVFGPYAVVARCQWHKRENVVRYLPESEQDKWRTRMTAAYRITDYTQSKEKLFQIREELAKVNLSALGSFDEGFEECLTLHRLGLAEHFHESFSTTNCIESLNSLIRRFTGHVTYWRNSEQRHRWIAVALLEIEQRMARVKNAKNLPLLQLAIGNEVQKKLMTLQGSDVEHSQGTRKRK
jgi:putative transposase